MALSQNLITQLLASLQDNDAYNELKAILDASGSVDLSGYVPITRTVAGHALSSNVTVTATDVGAPTGSGTSTGSNTGDQSAGSASGSVGLSGANGSASTFLRSDGAPALSQSIAPTWTGLHTFAVTARTSGVASYFAVQTPADTTLTASTESIGMQFGGNSSSPPTTVTRQWATGALTTQRQNLFVADTLAFVAASVVTTAVNLEAASPIAGTNATLTKSYAARFVASAAAHVPLSLKGATSQIGDYLETRDGSGNRVHFLPVATGTNVYFGIDGTTGGISNTRFGICNSTGAYLSYEGGAGIAVIGKLYPCDGTGANRTDGTFDIGESSHRFGTFYGIGAVLTAAVRTSGSPSVLTVTTPADTTLAASTESISVNLNCSATRQFSTGALTTQRECVIQAPTYSAVGASTFSGAYTAEIAGAPIAGTNVTLTEAAALRITLSQVTAKGLIIKQASASTANPFEVQLSTGTIAFFCSSAIGLSSPSNLYYGVNGSTSARLGNGSFGAYLCNVTGGGGLAVYTKLYPTDGTGIAATDGTLDIGQSANRFGKGYLIAALLSNVGQTASLVPLTVTGAASQTGDLVQFTNNTPTVLSRVTAAGWIQNAPGCARLAADATNATATLATIGLTTDGTNPVALVAGRKYVGRMSVKCINSTATEGIQFDFNGGSATMTSFWAAAGILASGGTDVIGTNISTSLAGVINFTTFTGESVVVFEISLVCNAAGTFIPRFAENSTAVGTATVRLGTFLWLEDSPN